MLSLHLQVDAHVLTRLSLAVFVEYVFGETEWSDDCEVLAAATWEWRKAIAVKGLAKSTSKRAGVAAVLALIRRNHKLWELFGEEWSRPERFSLLAQPFLISPCEKPGLALPHQPQRANLSGSSLCKIVKIYI